MELFEKAAKIMSGYNSLQKDDERTHVQKGVSHFLNGDFESMHSEFKKSGLTLQGLLYFSTREYLGHGDLENALIKLLIDNYSE